MVILIDSNQLCYQAYFANKGAFSYKGMRTEVVFGFLHQILKIFKKYRSNNFVFAWDSRKSNRKILFEGYKEKRKENLDEEERRDLNEGFVQFDLLRKVVLPTMGFNNIFMQTGFEADDIIGSVSHRTREDQVVIVSSDHDMYQLLGSGIVIYDPKKREERGVDWFRKEFALSEPLEYAKVLSLAGCSSDNVPGVPGVGVKTAIKYLKGELKKDSRAYKNIQKYGEDVAFYDRLVRLPFEGTGKFEVKENRLCEKFFWDNFSYYGFQSFMKKDGWQEWEDFIDWK